ncbi:MAG: hypothetical protein RLZZ200_10 [Pseudomonadota bacterium]|jgi:predicted Zn-dependent protease
MNKPRALAMWCLCGVLQTATAQNLGDLLDLVKGTSQDEETAMGRQIAGSLLGAAPLMPDRALQDYVNQVGRWVASQGERPELTWHFGVIASDDVNALSMPGGHVYLTGGLYRLLKSEAELAGVLGHEIAHVVRRHHLKLLQQGKVVDLGSRLFAKQAGENETVKKLIGSGAEVMARALDKQAEFEADRMGVVLAARAGYDAFGLPDVLQKIGRYGTDDGAVALLFKTHPAPGERLDQLAAAMGDRFDAVKGVSLAERLYRLPAK